MKATRRVFAKAFNHHLWCLFAVWIWRKREGERRAGKVWTFVLKWAINQIYRLLAAPKNCQWRALVFFSFSQPIRTDAKFWQVNRAWGTKSNPLEASHPSPIVNFVKWDDKRDEIHLTRWGRWSSESGTKSWRWSPQFRPCLLFWQVQTGPKLSISSKYDTNLL